MDSNPQKQALARPFTPGVLPISPGGPCGPGGPRSPAVSQMRQLSPFWPAEGTEVLTRAGTEASAVRRQNGTRGRREQRSSSLRVSWVLTGMGWSRGRASAHFAGAGRALPCPKATWKRSLPPPRKACGPFCSRREHCPSSLRHSISASCTRNPRTSNVGYRLPGSHRNEKPGKQDHGPDPMPRTERERACSTHKMGENAFFWKS